MNLDETKMGGPERVFSETTQDLVVGLRSEDLSQYHRAFELFSRNYWKPVYAFVRSAWAKENEEAKDLTQAFFLWLAEGEALRRFEPERGSLRKYLRVLLRSFVGHHETALGRMKRGGLTKTLSLDAGSAELEEFVPDPEFCDPEAAYDRTWRATVVRHALQKLRERYVAEGRETAFRIFEDFELTPGPVRPTYRELALRYHVEEARIKGRLLELRDEFRAEVRREVSRQVADPTSIDLEWNELFGT